jgi:hypothetical protein
MTKISVAIPARTSPPPTKRVPPFEGSRSRHCCRYREADDQSLGKRSAFSGYKVILRVLIGAFKCRVNGWHDSFERNRNPAQLFRRKSLCVNHARRRRLL